MTIRPVDLQVLIPRVTEVAKTQQITDHQDTLQQQQFAGKWQHIAAKREQQVQGTMKSEDGKVGRETHPQDHRQGKNGQKQEDSQHTNSDAELINHPSSDDPVRGNLIDIKT